MWCSYQYWQPWEECLNKQTKAWRLQWHTHCEQHCPSLCFSRASCKEICSVFKPAFILGAASQGWHRACVTATNPKECSLTEQPSASCYLLGDLLTLPKAPYSKTKLFQLYAVDFMHQMRHWFSLVDGDAAVITKLCRLNLILKGAMKPNSV